MSEKRPKPRWRSVLAGGAVVVAIMAAQAAAQADCAPLSANFVLCADGTPWDSAQWLQFGDGAALELDGLVLEFSEHWITRDASAAPDAALDSFIAAMMADGSDEGITGSETIRRDRFTTEALQVELVITTIGFDDEPPFMLATLLAEAAQAHILLTLGHDDEIDLETLDRKSRELVALIHPAQGR